MFKEKKLHVEEIIRPKVSKHGRSSAKGMKVADKEVGAVTVTQGTTSVKGNMSTAKEDGTVTVTRGTKTIKER